jgi:hypothetical protein
MKAGLREERQEGQENFDALLSSISRMVACTAKREEQSLQRYR